MSKSCVRTLCWSRPETIALGQPQTCACASLRWPLSKRHLRGSQAFTCKDYLLLRLSILDQATNQGQRKMNRLWKALTWIWACESGCLVQLSNRRPAKLSKSVIEIVVKGSLENRTGVSLGSLSRQHFWSIWPIRQVYQAAQHAHISRQSMTLAEALLKELEVPTQRGARKCSHHMTPERRRTSCGCEAKK